MSALSEKLSAALKSRDDRLIRRRLPEPTPTTHREIDFTSNDYLSLSTSPILRSAVLSALSQAHHILGSGGSRLLVPTPPHAALEARLCRFLHAEEALLFNSGFDANVGFFSSIPQPGDVVLYDAHIHASAHDGLRLSRLTPGSALPFVHNSVPALRRALEKLLRERDDLKEGKTSVFVTVESLYSMDGTIAPLVEIVECVEGMLPLGNGYVVVDEAHATGIYGPKGRGLVVALGLEKRVFARLHTFGKALGSSGAVLLTTSLVKDYLLNYARSLVYTTTLTYANVIAVNCSFDMLENGAAEVLSAHLLDLCKYFIDLLRPQLKKYPSSLLSLPAHLAEPSLPAPPNLFPELTPQRPWHPSHVSSWEIEPQAKRSQRSKHYSPPVPSNQNTTPSPSPSPLATPIIPILTPDPRSLSTFLLSYMPSSDPPSSSSSPSPSNHPKMAIHTKPIYPPTVPPGTSRVRICLHASHTREDVALLVQGIVSWADERMKEEREGRERWEGVVRGVGMGVWMEAKL
ncbi:PLP-dependent transferase [Paxillus ammoniavirescens]|nr:PLP-dependent transferase [Paxillus ammoniavirescens]